MPRKTFALGLALATLSSQSHAAPAYTLTYVGLDSVADINNAGQVTGYSYEYATERLIAQLWDKGVSSLRATPVGANSFGTAINDSGQITGRVALSDGSSRATLWASGSTSTLGGYGDGTAHGINNDGQVVGETYYGNTQHAVLWSNGATTYLPAFGGQNSTAYDINNSEVIAGAAAISANAIHAVLWSNGAITDLGMFAGGTDSAASGINDKGQAVGGSSLNANDWHAALWSGGSIFDLGTLGGGTYSYATDINNDGYVVGRSRLAGGDYRAFVWHAGTLQDLSDLDDSDWILTSADAINDHGQIVGSGLYQGRYATYMLTPVGNIPEPQTVPLLLAGLGLIGLMRRCKAHDKTENR